MVRLGIITNYDIKRESLWEFLKNEKVQTVNDVTLYIVKKKNKPIEKYIKKLQRYNVQKIILSKSLDQYIKNKNLFLKYAIEILSEKIFDNNRVLIIDKKGTKEAYTVLESLSRLLKYCTVYTSNTGFVEDLAHRIYELSGMPVTITDTLEQLSIFDFVIVLSGEFRDIKFKEHAFVFLADGKLANINSNTKIVEDISTISIKELRLPEDIYHLDLIEVFRGIPGNQESLLPVFQPPTSN